MGVFAFMRRLFACLATYGAGIGGLGLHRDVADAVCLHRCLHLLGQDGGLCHG